MNNYFENQKLELVFGQFLEKNQRNLTLHYKNERMKVELISTYSSKKCTFSS